MGTREFQAEVLVGLWELPEAGACQLRDAEVDAAQKVHMFFSASVHRN
jgi:hypothetical protein